MVSCPRSRLEVGRGQKAQSRPRWERPSLQPGTPPGARGSPPEGPGRGRSWGVNGPLAPSRILGLCWNEAECPQPQQKHPHGFKLLVQSCRVPQKINKHMLERQREVSGGSYSESHGRSGGLG